ncbi:phage major capsid protein [Leifsonia poae]|uniref:phage major capsid protein n=1 Tax=Leifsonia poae TaxID=110933 RepID=UPI003D679D31
MVAPGGTKPVSAITITSVDDHLRVVATLSDAVDRFALEDSSTLQQYLSSTLSYAVQRAIEDQVVNGTGVGEEFHGWASQSGVQVVPAAPDLISGLRSAITSLQGVGIVPSFFAVAPGDFEAAQLARNSSGAFDWAVDGSPVNAGRQQAWGVAVVPTAAVPAGTAWAVGQGAVQLSTDGQMRVDWGTPGTAFEQNQLVARAETRANQDILRPSGLVKVTLTAGA